MHKARIRRAAHTLSLAALVSIGAARQATSAPPPAEAFGRIPQTSAVELSPNGNLLAWADSSGAAQKVEIFDLQERKTLHTFEIDAAMKLRSLTWSDDETLLIDVSRTHHIVMGRLRKPTHEVFRVLAADVTGGPPRMLLMADADRQLVSRSFLLAPRTRKPKTVTLWTLDRIESAVLLTDRHPDSNWLGSVFEVDTRDGKGRLIARGTPFTDGWVPDGSGWPVVRSDWEPQRKLRRLLAQANGVWREFYRQVDQGPLDVYGLTADGAAVVAVGTLGQDRHKLWSIPLDGTAAKVLFEDPARDVAGVSRDRFTGNVVTVILSGAGNDMRWLDAAAEARHRAVGRAFPGREAYVFTRSENGQRVIAYVESPSVPPAYYLVDFASGKAEIVGEEYPELADAALGEVRTISYKARDGADIPAYLTFPPGVKPERLPLIVLVHDGPEARDELGFDWQAQFLATRGYLVLQPQFRGSTGFGEEHRKAGYQQWGGVMQNDLTDGVSALIEQGLADRRRVGIIGTGYGGYAALAGAAFTPEVYACAVSINGISDLHEWIEHIADTLGSESATHAYWRSHTGAPSVAKVVEKSPARAARNVRAPILLLHGADDTFVPVTQSETMVKALGQLQKPHAFVELPDEDHWLSRSATRIRVLKEIDTFLAANLR